MLIALFLHMLLCDWNSGLIYSGNNDFNGSRTRAIVPFGAEFGIIGRSSETIVPDALLGIALPILLVGSALFVIVTPGRGSHHSKPSQ